MFTNNYLKFKKFWFFNTSQSVVDFAGESRTYTYGTNLYSVFADIGYYMDTARCRTIASGSSSNITMNGCNAGIYFGSGSTPAAKSDYTLVNPITSGLTITNPSSLVYQEDGEGQHSYSASFILANTSDAEINIYEIGLFGQTAAYSSGARYYYPILMERTVLTEPINIQPGESKLVTYKVTFNQTLNVD